MTASPDTADLDQAARTRLTRRGLRLAQLTVAYNVVEGAVAVTAGLLAGLVSLVGFGVDSGIESMTAILVGLRLAARLRHGTADEQRERRVLRAVAVSFFLLAGYVVAEGTRSLISDEGPSRSRTGLALLVASLLIMPWLAARKQQVGRALNDPLILADAAETKICVLLSLSTLAGLALFSLTGASWLDPVAGYVVAVFALKEGREAWHGELTCQDGCDDREDGLA